MKLEIPADVMEFMHEHAKEIYPDECCGFLFGEDDDVRKIDEARSVDNSKEGDKRRRFEIKPEDYLAAEKYAAQQNKMLLGIYHSHPDHPAKPSGYDQEKAMPFFSYVILSVEKGNVKAVTSWQLNDGGEFVEEEIKTEQKMNK